MNELVLRAIVAGGIAVASIGIALVMRRGGAFVRHPHDPVDLARGLVLFTTSQCESCGEARAVVEAAGSEYTEVRYEQDRATFDANQIQRVPSLVWSPGDSGERSGWIATGVPSVRLLVRWLADSS